MTDVLEREAATPTAKSRWRLSRGTIRLLILLAVIAATVWVFTRGPGVAFRGPLLTPGSLSGLPDCDGRVAMTEVDDTFGGGGTILDYVDGARCEMNFTVANPTGVPVTVLAVDTTPDYFTSALRIVSATRDPASFYTSPECAGCTHEYEPFSPMTIPPGDEWEIAVQGVMADCKPDGRGRGFDSTGSEVIGMTVKVSGITRHVQVELRHPWAVRHGACDRPR
jgi:hypothetical protein